MNTSHVPQLLYKQQAPLNTSQNSHKTHFSVFQTNLKLNLFLLKLRFEDKTRHVHVTAGHNDAGELTVVLKAKAPVYRWVVYRSSSSISNFAGDVFDVLSSMAIIKGLNRVWNVDVKLHTHTQLHSSWRHENLGLDIKSLSSACCKHYITPCFSSIFTTDLSATIMLCSGLPRDAEEKFRSFSNSR